MARKELQKVKIVLSVRLPYIVDQWEKFPSVFTHLRNKGRGSTGNTLVGSAKWNGCLNYVGTIR